MQLDFYNCPQPEKFEEGKFQNLPPFISFKPDSENIKKIAKEYEQYKNVLIIGQGGSINNFYGLYSTFPEQVKKTAYFLNTVDPDYIHQLKHILKPEDTLVIAISKSGETITTIEGLMQFLNFPLLFICGQYTPMREIADRLKAKVVFHPDVGGRYTAFTEVALLPATICGIDIDTLYEGAKEWYGLYQKDNLAFRAASVFWQLEQKGFVDVFMPVYAHYLLGLSYLIVQLCHESFGKDGKGQTYFAHEAPESQHHTNQRFFGGQKNIAGFFLSSQQVLFPTMNEIPYTLHSAQLKGQVLFNLNKIPLEQSLRFELEGTLEDAKIHGLPVAHLSINDRNFKEIGSLVAFWQMYAVYASILRNVNPYDQPQVENSKNISFTKRLNFKGLL